MNDIIIQVRGWRAIRSIKEQIAFDFEQLIFPPAALSVDETVRSLAVAYFQGFEEHLAGQAASDVNRMAFGQRLMKETAESAGYLCPEFFLPTWYRDRLREDAPTLADIEQQVAETLADLPPHECPEQLRSRPVSADAHYQGWWCAIGHGDFDKERDRLFREGKPVGWIVCYLWGFIGGQRKKFGRTHAQLVEFLGAQLAWALEQVAKHKGGGEQRRIVRQSYERYAKVVKTTMRSYRQKTKASRPKGRITRPTVTKHTPQLPEVTL